MKHFWKSLFLLAVLAVLFPASALADTVEYPVNGYHNLVFDTETGTITGNSTTNGAKYEHWPAVYTLPSQINGVPVRAIGPKAFQSGGFSAQCLKIPEGVTTIGDGAFQSASLLRIVSLPAGLTRIGKEAFSNSGELFAVSLPDSITEIDDKAFSGCYQLCVPVLPACLKRIGDEAFAYCAGASDLRVLPEGLRSVGRDAFEHCHGIKSLVIPSTLSDMGEEAFFDCDGLISVTVSEGVSSIGNSAFESCTNLETVSLPSTLRTIGELAFESADNLRNCAIPDGVVTIGKAAFSSAGFQELYLPSSVSSIGEAAFSGIDAQTIVLPKNLKSMGQYAFSGCERLESLYIPAGAAVLGKEAFRLEESLTDVYYGGSQNQWSALSGVKASEINTYSPKIHYGASMPGRPAAPASVPEIPLENIMAGVRFEDYFSNIVEYPAHHGNSLLFNTNTGVILEVLIATTHNYDDWPETYAIPAQINGVPVRGLGPGAFLHSIYCKNLIIPEGVTAIPCAAFGECGALETVSLPSSLTTIGYKAFYHCYELRTAPLPDGVTSIGDSAFKFCSKLSVPVLPSRLERIGNEAFRSCAGASDLRVLPESLRSVGIYAFGGCRGIQSLSIPGTLSRISRSAFSICSGMKELTIAEGVETIGVRAFDGCNQLETVSLPSTLRTIEERAFLGCNALTACTLPDGVRSIGLYAFDGIKIQNLAFPGSVTRIGPHAYGATAVETVVLPRSLKCVSFEAFNYCKQLKTLYIPVGVEVLGYRSFRDDSALKDVYYEGSQSQWNAVRGVKASELTASSPTIHFNAAMPGQAASPATAPSVTPAAPVSDGPFADVWKANYFCDSVTWAVERGITNGASQTTFLPHNPCTRAHVLTFLWRANGAPEPLGENPYTDVPAGQYYTKAAVWAYEQGLTDGVEFHGEEPCRRKMAALYLWRLAGSPAVEDNPFQDTIGVYAQAAAWAAAQGITNGTSETTFNPEGVCTRAQIVTFLYRAYADQVATNG